MKILFLSRWYPYPPSNGSKLRVYNLLRGLTQHHQVTLLSFIEPSEVPNIDELESICEEVKVIAWEPYNPDSLQARLGILSSRPRFVVNTFSPEMKQYIDQAFQTKDFDLVIASQLDMASYGKCFQNVPALFEEVELGVFYDRFRGASSLKNRFRNGLTWFKHRHYLDTLLENFQACTVVSELEKEYLSQIVNGSKLVEVIPNSVTLADYKHIQKSACPNTLIYTGAFSYYPNYEAMQWFVGRVFPLVRTQIPDVHLTITGDHSGYSLPSTEQITLTGFVDDVYSLIARSWISIVPLHTGGGTRLKILEAMALGTPVVSTSKGAEGLDIEAGKHLLIADTPEEFAGAVVRLLKEAELRDQLVSNAYQLVKEKYDWAVVMPRFLSLVERVANV